MRSGCCARAASGHAVAAPPSSVMNSRRLKSNMRPSPRWADHGTLSLHLAGRPVLGADLNCSESVWAPSWLALRGYHAGRRLLHCGSSTCLMSAQGLGCVKTPALAADVETFWR